MQQGILLLLLCVLATNCLDNGLGLTPQMGWNSWNHFGCKINEELIKSTADKLISSGLAAKGYVYLNLDDCWQVTFTSLRSPEMKQLVKLSRISKLFLME